MIRRLSYALRTLVGPWLVLPALVLETLNFVQRGMPWRGEGMWTVEWFAIALFVIGPLAAGVAAVDAARLSRPGNIHLVVAVPRSSLVYLRAAAWCAGPLVVVHLAAIGAGVLAGPVTRPSVGWAAMAAAAVVQCLAIVWYVAVGSAIGRFLSPLVAGLTGAAAGFLLFYLLSDSLTSERFAPLALGAATTHRIGLTYHGGYLAGQLVVLAVTAALLLVVPVRVRAGARVPGAAGVGAVAAAAAVVVAAGSLLPGTRVLLADPVPPDHCVGEAPRICLYHEHRRLAPLVTAQVDRLVSTARERGYAALVPDQVIESSRSYDAGGLGTFSLQIPYTAYEQGVINEEDLIRELVIPDHCPKRRGEEPPSERYWWREAALVMTWLDVAGVDYDPEDFQWWQEWPVQVLSPEEVAEIMADFAACDLEGRR